MNLPYDYRSEISCVCFENNVSMIFRCRIYLVKQLGGEEKREITIDFFENFVRTEVYETFISDVVIAEIEDTSDSKKRQELLDIIVHYPIGILDLNPGQETEIEELASKYVEAKIIPEKKIADALHIATSVVCKINYLVSWNFRHLANINKEKRIHIVNLENNYRADIRLITPLELIDYEN